MQQHGERATPPDLFSLIGAAVLLIAALMGSFWASDHYHIPLVAVLLVWASILFCTTVGWDYRKGFKSARFALFFCLWLAANGWIFYLTAAYASWLLYVWLLPVQLGIGYILAFRLFGIRPEPKGSKNLNSNLP
jgi:hypothetical protein